MAEEIALNISVGVADGKRSVADLRNEMKTLTDEVNNTQRGTEAYAKAIQKLGETKAELKDLKEDIAALDPDAKAKAFIGLGQTMVAGFTAAQGAAALFGSENEDIQKGILKMQAAIGVLSGIQAAADAADQVGRLKIIALQQLQVLETKKQIVATEGATIAQRLWNLALSANPIGLVVTALVTLTAAVGAYVYATKESTKEQQVNTKALENSIKTREELEQSIKNTEIALKEETKVITKEQADKLRLEQEYRNKLKDIGDKYAADAVKKENQNTATQLELKKRRDEDYKIASIDFQDKYKLITERYNNEEKQEEQKKHDEILALQKQAAEKRKAQLELEMREYLDLYVANKFKELEKRTEYNLIESTFDEEAYKASLEKQKENNLLKIQDEEAFLAAKVSVTKSTLGALSSLGNLAIKDEKKRVEFQKKMAVAQIAIDTAASVAKAIRDGNRLGVTPIDKAVLIAANIATVLGAFAQIKGILSQANVGGGTPSGSFGGGGSSTSTILTDVKKRDDNSQSVTPTTTSYPTGIQKVVLVESDVTKSQNRVKMIENWSSF